VLAKRDDGGRVATKRTLPPRLYLIPRHHYLTVLFYRAATSALAFSVHAVYALGITAWMLLRVSLR